MKIRYKATLIMLGAILIVSIASGYAYYKMNLNLIHEGMQKNLQTVLATIQANIEFKSSQAESLASLVVNQPEIQQAVKERNREKLIQIITPALDIQKEKYGEVDAQFHLPGAISFLRVYKPKIWGDDLSTTRELVLISQTQRRPLKGVEISTTGVSIKGIAVMEDKQGFIGTFEVGESFQSVLENVKQITGFETAAFVNHALMTQIATAAPPAEKDRIIGGYQNIFATNWTVFQEIITPQMMNEVNESIVKTEEVNGQFDGIVILPLLDFNGKNIGSMWAVGDFSKYQQALRTNTIVSIAITLLQAVILSAIVLIIFNALYFLPIDHIVTCSEQINEGKTTQVESELARWMNRKDEIGSLANTIQKLNQKIRGQHSDQSK